MMLYLNHVLDLIPMWVWIVAVVVALAFTYQFWGPVWLMLPRPVKIGLGAIGALLAAFLGGRYKGAKDERDMQANRNANAIKTRDAVEADVKNSTDQQVDERLKRWQRD